jgi:hypothetical protein
MGLKKFLEQHGIEVENLGDRIVFRSAPAKPLSERHGWTQNAPTLLSGDGVQLMPEGGPPVVDPGLISWGFESTPVEDSEPQPKKGILIGLGGYLRNGKDEVADELVAEYDFTKYGMSDPLNEALLTLNPWIPVSGSHAWKHYDTLHDDVGYVEAKKNPEVRRLLQMLGTDVGRNMIDQNVWTTIARKKIQADLDQGKNVVITAIRFPNEVEMVGEMGGVLAWVHRPGEEFQPKPDAHASETSVRPGDFMLTLVNDGSLYQLRSATRNLFQGVLANIHRNGAFNPAQKQMQYVASTFAEPQESWGYGKEHGGTLYMDTSQMQLHYGANPLPMRPPL